MRNSIARSPLESRAVRDSLEGKSAGALVPIPELIALSGGDVRRKFLSLENEEQRLGFIDSIVNKIGSNFGNWVRFYEAVEIIREHEAYWKGKGFPSFEEFWRTAAGPTFTTFKELEDVYNFAKTACPELFHIDFGTAKALRIKLARIKVTASVTGSSATKSKRRMYQDQSEAKAAVAEALNWRRAGSNSLEYRLARLKKDSPNIAARILAGEFFKNLNNGMLGIDIVAAEIAAYGERKRPRSPLTRGERIAKLVKEAARSSLVRQEVVDELCKVGWLVNGIVATTKKRRSG